MSTLKGNSNTHLQAIIFQGYILSFLVPGSNPISKHISFPIDVWSEQPFSAAHMFDAATNAAAHNQDSILPALEAQLPKTVAEKCWELAVAILKTAESSAKQTNREF